MAVREVKKRNVNASPLILLLLWHLSIIVEQHANVRSPSNSFHTQRILFTAAAPFIQFSFFLKKLLLKGNKERNIREGMHFHNEILAVQPLLISF